LLITVGITLGVLTSPVWVPVAIGVGIGVGIGEIYTNFTTPNGESLFEHLIDY
jgi:small-conductance mechanosensitive channel